MTTEFTSLKMGDTDALLIPLEMSARELRKNNQGKFNLKPLKPGSGTLTLVVHSVGLKPLASLGTTMAFVLPAHVRKIRFNTHVFEVPLPELVFVWNPMARGSKSQMLVLVHSAADPKYQHLAAFQVSNVWNDGRICFGDFRPGSSVTELVTTFLEAPFNNDLSLKPVFLTERAWAKLQEIPRESWDGPKLPFFEAWSKLELEDVSDFTPSGPSLLTWMMSSFSEAIPNAEASVFELAGRSYMAIDKSMADLMQFQQSQEDAERVMLINRAGTFSLAKLQHQEGGIFQVVGSPGTTVWPRKELLFAEGSKVSYRMGGNPSLNLVIDSYKSTVNDLLAAELKKPFNPESDQVHARIRQQIWALIDSCIPPIRAKLDGFVGVTHPLVTPEQWVSINNYSSYHPYELYVALRAFRRLIPEQEPETVTLRIEVENAELDLYKITVAHSNRQYTAITDMTRAASLKKNYDKYVQAYGLVATAEPQPSATLSRDFSKAVADLMVDLERDVISNQPVMAPYLLVAGHGPLASVQPYQVHRHDDGTMTLSNQDRSVTLSCQVICKGSEQQVFWLYQLGAFGDPQDFDRFAAAPWRGNVNTSLLYSRLERGETVALEVGTGFEFRKLFLPKGTVVQISRDPSGGEDDFQYIITALPEVWPIDLGEADRAKLVKAFAAGKPRKFRHTSKSPFLSLLKAHRPERWPLRVIFRALGYHHETLNSARDWVTSRFGEEAWEPMQPVSDNPLVQYCKEQINQLTPPAAQPDFSELELVPNQLRAEVIEAWAENPEVDPLDFLTNV